MWNAPKMLAIQTISWLLFWDEIRNKYRFLFLSTFYFSSEMSNNWNAAAHHQIECNTTIIYVYIFCWRSYSRKHLVTFVWSSSKKKNRDFCPIWRSVESEQNLVIVFYLYWMRVFFFSCVFDNFRFVTLLKSFDYFYPNLHHWMFSIVFIYRGRKRFVSEGDGGHIKPETLTYRDWIHLNSKPIYLKPLQQLQWKMQPTARRNEEEEMNLLKHLHSKISFGKKQNSEQIENIID